MGVYETTPDITFCTDTQARRMFLCSALRPIITDFLNTLDYTVPPKTDHTALRNAMLSYAKSSGVPYDGDKHARQCFVTGLSVAGVSSQKKKNPSFHIIPIGGDRLRSCSPTTTCVCGRIVVP